MRAQRPQPNVLFGRHLKALRRERGLSQEVLAESADLGVNIIGRLERALIAPGLVTLLKLSVALGVPAQDLLEPFTPEVIASMKLGVTGAAPAGSRSGQK